MRLMIASLLAAACVCVSSVSVSGVWAAEKSTPAALNFKVKTIKGEEVDLGKYQGKVVMIVNVASKCGATPQYAQLESVYDKYKDQGLVILGFPCNQFGGQEPGTNDQIAEFCKATYGVSFDMFDKIDVNGDNAAPLYKFLTSESTDPQFPGKIGWNFEKFVIGRDGKIVARYGTRVKPDAPDVIKTLEAELAKK